MKKLLIASAFTALALNGCTAGSQDKDSKVKSQVEESVTKEYQTLKLSKDIAIPANTTQELMLGKVKMNDETEVLSKVDVKSQFSEFKKGDVEVKILIPGSSEDAAFILPLFPNGDLKPDFSIDSTMLSVDRTPMYHPLDESASGDWKILVENKSDRAFTIKSLSLDIYSRLD